MRSQSRKQQLAQNAPFTDCQTEGKEEMKLAEYIESICQEPLSEYQKAFFEYMEKRLENGYEISMPPRIGRTLRIQTIWAIEQWKRLGRENET